MSLPAGSLLGSLKRLDSQRYQCLVEHCKLETMGKTCSHAHVGLATHAWCCTLVQDIYSFIHWAGIYPLGSATHNACRTFTSLPTTPLTTALEHLHETC